MSIQLQEHYRGFSIPANLRINEQINAYRKKCADRKCTRPYHHFAFGQSPYPPPPAVVQALRDNAGQHSYLPTAGIPELRKAVADYHNRHFGVDCSAKQVVISPGSKEMIADILSVLEGALIIPTPAWVSYLPQGKIIKKEVLALRTREQDGFKVTADVLEDEVSRITTGQKIMILNHPNNPTGAMYTKDELAAIAAVCRKHNVIVIADEIYALTSFDRASFNSMMTIYPEGTIVTGGLSKDRSCGGWRFGLGIFPKDQDELVTDVLKVAGSTYSCVSAPIQYAALTAYSDSAEIDQYIRDGVKINQMCADQLVSMLHKMKGVKTTTPHGAFYLYVDFNELSDSFRKLELPTCGAFCQDLLEVEHTALLAGDALMLPQLRRFRRCEGSGSVPCRSSEHARRTGEVRPPALRSYRGRRLASGSLPGAGARRQAPRALSQGVGSALDALKSPGV